MIPARYIESSVRDPVRSGIESSICAATALLPGPSNEICNVAATSGLGMRLPFLAWDVAASTFNRQHPMPGVGG